RTTPSVAEQEGQVMEMEATGAPQNHHHTLNQQVGSITKYATENNLSEAQNYMQLWRQNGEKMDVKASLKIYLMMELFLKRMVLMANTSTIFRFS
ncbi:hypothetical protein M2975_17950, partial [Klebsiella pneumoniae]|uniref:hypothetical protein n=1 Tax=Klebsiella pneumoniae TaxID=573 RepID=UPI00200CB91D